MSKKPWQSKTLAFNALAVLVFVAGAFGYAEFLPDKGLMALAAAVMNLALRWVTSQPIRQ